MKNVEISIFNIAKTQVNREAVKRWLDFIGVSPEFELPDEDEITDPALLVALAAKRCYKSFEIGLNPNVTKVRKDWCDYIDNVLAQGHGSVFEHACYTFAIEGVSRIFTGELNRHRAGVGISEGSMRYIRYEDMPFWMPTSITLTKEEEQLDQKWYANKCSCFGFSDAEYKAFDMIRKKLSSQGVFESHFKQTKENYKQLQKIWFDELHPTSKFHGKKQITSMMRRIIPMGIATGGVWTMNIRALRHIIAMRASKAAEEEIAYVFSKIAKIMIEEEPLLLGDFTQDAEGFYHPKYPKV